LRMEVSAAGPAETNIGNRLRTPNTPVQFRQCRMEIASGRKAVASLYWGLLFLRVHPCIGRRERRVDFISRVLAWIWRQYRVLWTCRISVLSAIGGGAVCRGGPARPGWVGVSG